MDILGAILAFKTVTGVVKGVSGVDKALQALFNTSSKKFGSGFGSLISLITAHPVVAAVAGITALTIGIIVLSNEMEHQRIASHFGDISISLEEINELVNPITENVDKVAGAFEDNKTKLKTAKDNFSDIAKAVQETADSFGKNDLEQDVEGFAKQLDDLLNSALEVNAATFDTSAIKSAFAMDGVIDEEEQAILDRLGELGGSIAEKIKNYGEEIHKITQTAIDENRELTEAEIENLKTLYQKLADMTAQQENIKTAATWERLKNGDYTYDSYAEVADRIKEAQEQAEKSREAIEQSGYEALMEMIAAAKANGESDEELEKLLNDGIEKIKKDLEASRVEDKRYERDVILAWTQGVFTDMAKSYAYDDDELKKMQQYFELMLTNPTGMDREEVGKLFSGIEMDSRDVDLFNRSMTMLDDIKKHFGLDFAEEWERLNDEIGDSVFSLDDFYGALTRAIDDVTVLSVEDIFPSIEEFKKQPELYDEVLTEWARVSNYIVKISGEFDAEAFDKFWEPYIAEKRAELYAPAPSSYVQQTSSNVNDNQMRLNIHLYKDEEELAQERAFIGPRQPFYDLNVNNGK